MTFTRTLLALTMAIVPAVSFASEKTSEQKLEEITQILKRTLKFLIHCTKTSKSTLRINSHLATP